MTGARGVVCLRGLVGGGRRRYAVEQPERLLEREGVLRPARAGEGAVLAQPPALLRGPLHRPAHLPGHDLRRRPVIGAGEAHVPEERVRPGPAVAVGSAVRRGAPEGAQHEREGRGQILACGGGEALVKPPESGGKLAGAAFPGGVQHAEEHLLDVRHDRGRERRQRVFFFKESASSAARAV